MKSKQSGSGRARELNSGAEWAEGGAFRHTNEPRDWKWDPDAGVVVVVGGGVGVGIGWSISMGWVIGQAKCTWTSANDRDVPAKKINTSPLGSLSVFLIFFLFFFGFYSDFNSRLLVRWLPGFIFIGNEFLLANQFLSTKAKATPNKCHPPARKQKKEFETQRFI